MGSCSIAQGPQLCEDLGGWDGGWVGVQLKREGICVCTELIHVVV